MLKVLHEVMAPYIALKGAFETSLIFSLVWMDFAWNHSLPSSFSFLFNLKWTSWISNECLFVKEYVRVTIVVLMKHKLKVHKIVRHRIQNEHPVELEICLIWIDIWSLCKVFQSWKKRHDEWWKNWEAQNTLWFGENWRTVSTSS